MQLGTTKDQGLYNKPWAEVHLGALAAGTIPQYNTMVLAVSRRTLVAMAQSRSQVSTRAICSVRCDTGTGSFPSTSLSSSYSTFDQRSILSHLSPTLCNVRK